MDKVRIRLAFIPVPVEDRGDGLVWLQVDSKYINLLKRYAMEHSDTLGDVMAVIEPWNWDYTEEGFNFFHKVRDMILDKQGGPDAVRAKSERDALKKQLKEEFGPPGKESIKEYTRRELWDLCQGAVRWLQEAGGDLGGLRIDFEELEAFSRRS